MTAPADVNARELGFVVVAHPKTPAPPLLLLSEVIDPAAGSELWGWFPHATYPETFRDDVRIGMWCYRTRAGDRVFLPADGWEELVRHAAAVGVAVRERATGDRGDAHRHAVLNTAHAYARRTKEFAARKFRTKIDLVQRGRARKTVLPGGLGLSPGSTGRGWGVNELLDEGRAIVERAAGGRAPLAPCIAAGLHAAAAANPAPLPPSRAARRAALRAALFVEPDRRAGGRRTVVQHAAYAAFADLYFGRVTRKSGEAAGVFDLWHSGPSTNVPKLVAVAITRAFGADPADARRAVIDVCWESFVFAGSAVSAAMKQWLVLAARVGDLTGREVKLFRWMYTGVPELGGIPLAVLHDRLDLLEPWLAGAALAPTRPPAWRVLYTMLGYYTYMAGKRRGLDLQAKEGSQIARSPGGVRRGTKVKGVTDSVVSDDPGAAAEQVDFLAAFYTRVRIACGVTCPCGAGRWSTRRFETGARSRYRFSCSGCGTTAVKTPAVHLLTDSFLQVGGGPD